MDGCICKVANVTEKVLERSTRAVLVVVYLPLTNGLAVSRMDGFYASSDEVVLASEESDVEPLLEGCCEI